MRHPVLGPGWRLSNPETIDEFDSDDEPDESCQPTALTEADIETAALQRLAAIGWKSARACGSRAGTAESQCSVTARRTGTVCRGVRWDASQHKGVLELAEIGQLLDVPGERRQQVRGQGPSLVRSQGTA